MLRGIVVPVVVFIVAAGLWVSQCSGPRPSVVGSPRVVAPQQPGDTYKVETTIRNDGPGHGQARVTVRLKDTASGEAYSRDQGVELERGETARVVVELAAPLGSYEPEVEAEYPPR